jgi:transcriptional regulator
MMYRPPHFSEDRPEFLHALIRAHPLATIITAGVGGLMANLIPMILGDDGTLHGHLARANNQLPALREGAETLLIFQGPQAYVTPSWYASKAEHGRVVPTWNYVIVQARGTPRVIDDPALLKAHLEQLTASQEDGRDSPWKVDDAPADFIERMLRNIIGFEVAVTSQNRTEADWRGAAEGLAREGQAELAAMVVERGNAA